MAGAAAPLKENNVGTISRALRHLTRKSYWSDRTASMASPMPLLKE